MASSKTMSTKAPPPKALILFNVHGTESEGGPEATFLPEGVRLVADALDQSHFFTAVFDVEDDIERAIAAIAVETPSIVFNLVDQFGGDETRLGLFASFLEIYEVEFTGSDGLTLCNCKDRLTTHLQLRDAGVSVPPFVAIRNPDSLVHCNQLRYPVVVTQTFQDAYNYEGIHHLVTTPSALLARVDMLSRDFDMPLLVEEYPQGQRVQAVVMDKPRPAVLPLTKYTNVASSEHDFMPGICLAELPADIQLAVEETACRAFQVMGCRDWAQIDLILTEENHLAVVDVRPMFDLSTSGAFYCAAQHSPLGLMGTISQIAKQHLSCEELGALNTTAHPIDTR